MHTESSFVPLGRRFGGSNAPTPLRASINRRENERDYQTLQKQYYQLEYGQVKGGLKDSVLPILDSISSS